MKAAADRRSRIYAATSLGVMLLFVVVVGGFCALIDPYGILGSPAVHGLTEEKTAAAERPRLSKPYRVLQARPQTLLIGSSALNIGINPSTIEVPSGLQPMYNLGIDGASMDVQRSFLLHVLSETRLRMVVFLVSFEDMLAPSDGWAGIDGDDFERRLRVKTDGSPNTDFKWARVRDFTFVTLSLEALGKSFLTLLTQGDPTRNKQTSTGFEQRDRLSAWSSNEGPLALLQTSFNMRLANIGETHGRPEYRLSALIAAIKDARDAGAEVAVLIQPTYVAGLELRRQLGLSEQAARWLVALVTAAEQVAAQTGGLGHVSIWDFGGFTPFNQEPLPRAGDRLQLRWFFEAIHFRPDLGTLIMNKVLTGSGPAGLGARINSSTVIADVEEFRAAQGAWVATHPSEVAEISRLRRIAQEAVCRSTPRLCNGLYLAD